MKKLILLLLLPLWSIAQTSTGQEAEFDYGIKNNSSQFVATPDTLVTKGTDGTYGHTSSYRLPISNDTFDALQNKQDRTSTALISGCTFINNGATFSVDPGVFQIIDNSTIPYTKTTVNFAGVTNVTPLYFRTLLYIDSSGTVVQLNGATGDLTPLQRRDNLFIALFAYVSGTIQAPQFTPSIDYDISGRLFDLAETLGARNRDGNIIAINGANLQLNKGAGHTYRAGSNYATNKKVPDVTDDAAIIPIPGSPNLIGYRNGSGGWTYEAFTGSLTPTFWDNGSGTKQTVTNNRFTIPRLYFFNGTNTFVIYLGQTEYTSLDAAKGAIYTETRTVDPATSVATHRASIPIEKGATSLSTQPTLFFIENHIDSRASSGTGGSGGAQNMQSGYNNSVTPQITTTTALGAVTIRRGSSADADNILVGQNGAGANTFSVTGAGVLNASNKQNSLATDGTGVKFPTVDAVNSEFTNKNKAPKLSDFFINNGGAGDEDAVNTALAFCVSKGIRYLNIDVDFKTENAISTNYRNVILVGKGKISSRNQDNFNIEIGNFGGSIDEKINRKQTLDLSLLRQNQDTLKIVIFGVSIDVGYDWDSSVPYQRGGADQIEPSNSWYDYFINQLMIQFPNKKIKVFNRAIGGAYIGQYATPIGSIPNSGRFPENPATPWIEVIEDLQPDIVINSHGMNDYDNYLQIVHDVHGIMNGWAKKPKIVMLSTPTPNFLSTTTDYRNTKFNIQGYQNFVAKEQNLYLIDVAKQYNRKVFGTDYNEFSFKESVYDFSFVNVFDTNSITSTGFIFPPSTLNKVTVQHARRGGNFAYDFTFRYTSAFTLLEIRNQLNGLFSITPTSVSAYPITLPVVGNVTKSFSFAPNTDYHIVCEFSSNQMRMFIDDVLVVSSTIGYAPSNFDTDVFTQTNTGTITISNFKLFESEYRHFLPSITQNEAWGTTNDGNAINHPSHIGLKEVYFPAIKEFVNDLKEFEESTGNGLITGIQAVSDGDLTINSQGTGALAGGAINWKMNVAGGNPESFLAQIKPSSFSSSSMNTLDFYVGAWDNNNDKGSIKASLRSDGYFNLNGNLNVGGTETTRKLNVVATAGQTPFAAVGSGGYILIDNTGSGNNYYNASTSHNFEGAPAIFSSTISATSYTGGATLTGTPTAPTATAGTNTTQIATTAFVQTQASGGNYTPTLTNTANITTSTLTNATYTRIGDIVTVNIGFSVDPTAANTNTVLTITLPIARTVSSVLNSGSGAIFQSNTRLPANFQTSGNTTDGIIYMYPSSTGTYAGSVTIQYNVN